MSAGASLTCFQTTVHTYIETDWQAIGILVLPNSLLQGCAIICQGTLQRTTPVPI